ncbi:uncharacterized protein LOC108742180 isoform X3 [Agrilus planipennis]|uniref:28S ribosomal protein S14, mitochondrial n=1 Tax=Agrilus planipennis TaxID=224129 RepID=A0A1W4XJV8_AGRPL|nr:uncharacterized protein LOC108742180 isoform X2 [Agrilus planipennis]XP_018332743.1 uncharacterized protein LOC108742180 isoform X3 [Agrilus planipennis]
MSTSSLQRPSFWPIRSQKKVGFGTPAANHLQRGDIITKINNYDSRDIRQQDARNLFRNSDNEIKVAVQREHHPYYGSGDSSLHSSRTYSPLPASPHLSPKSGSDYMRGGTALTPTQGAPFEEMIEYDMQFLPNGRNALKHNRHNLDVHVDRQPYRTTPLVLPGAKIKREQAPTESYLRHHPNPSVRAPPMHLETENILKKKVADSVLQKIIPDEERGKIVHKQFNSPIGLYSESAIADTIQKQTGLPARRRAVKYDPTKSEIYKAIQEEQLGDKYQEVTVPPHSKIYIPNKVDIPKFQQERTKYVGARMIRDVKRRNIVKEYAPTRLRINSLRKNDILPAELQCIADEEIGNLPRDSAVLRLQGRCVVTSRPRGVAHRWRLSRIVFRDLADHNKLSGIQRAMW